MSCGRRRRPSFYSVSHSCVSSHVLPAPRRLAGAEQGSGVSEGFLNPRCGRVRAAKYAPRGRRHILERRHGLADIVERGAVVVVYATALYMTAGASRAEVLEAVAICEELLCRDRRVLGPSHPDTLDGFREIDRACMTLEDYRKFKS